MAQTRFSFVGASPLMSNILMSFLVLTAGPATAQDSARTASDTVAQGALESMTWREVGPYRGGRSAAVAGLPGDRQTYYLGATGGGVWKTQDAGLTWNNVSDGFFGGSIGAVAVSAWDANVVYVGGGEKTVRGNVSHGDGVWKSVDAGANWRRVGLTDTRHVSRIRIHPKDADWVYVCAMGHLFGPNEERGVFRSRDGGESWDKIQFVNEDAGCVDLAMDPNNPRVLYSAFWRVLRTPWSLESGGEGSSLWKSVDGGDTWVELSANEGLPEGTRGIMGVSVSAADSQNLYAMVEAEEGGLFRSRDGGDTWARVSDSRDLRQRAWYYTRVYADPGDVESVYVLNVGFHHSKDGGKSFSRISVPHGDNHDLWIDPGDPLRMIESNDGGANVSEDGGASWTAQTNQPTAQMYRVSTDNAFPYRLLGGQQDNSTVRLRSRSFSSGLIGVRDWEATAGCECGHVVAKPDDPDIVYGGCYGGRLERLNHRTGESRDVSVWPDDPMGWGAAELKYRFQWNFPLFFSPHDSSRIYTAAQVLFQSDDEGQTWEPISPDLTRDAKDKQGPSGGPITKDNTSVEYYSTIFAALESPHEKGVLWTGSDDGLIHLSRDGGESWSNVTPKGLPEWSQVNSMEAHPFEPGGLYVAATRYKLDDFRPLLYKTTDYGATWTPIVKGIDADHFTRVIRADPERRGLLYAGTERGVYVSFDDGGHWQSLQLELPVVPVTDLAVKEGDLVAATQGRGFWILDDLSLLHAVKSGEPGNHLYPPRPAVRWVAGGFSRSGGNAGTNPPSGAVIRYHLADDWTPAAGLEDDQETSADTDSKTETPGSAAEELDGESEIEEEEEESEPRLEILDSEGEVIRTFRAEKEGDDDKDRILDLTAGAHSLEWDLTYPGAEDFPGMVIWNGYRAGPRATPGTYRVRLTLGDWSREADLHVVPDPRSTATPDDFTRQHEFLISVRDKLTDTHQAIGKIRRAKEQIAGLTSRWAEDQTDLKDMADAMVKELGEVEKALYQTKNRSRQDPLNFPIRLNDKLAGVYGTAWGGDFAPTAGTYAVRDELFAAIDEQLKRLETLWSEELPRLNQAIAEAEVPAIHLEDPEEE